ncbi:MAG: hypothetical protein SGPRY_011322, partial [Prymnesium sp.]
MNLEGGAEFVPLTAAAFDDLTESEELDYLSAGWTDVEVSTFSELVEHKALPNIVRLRLGKNRIGDAGIERLATMLVSAALPQLKELDLDRNAFGDVGMQALVAACKSSTFPLLCKLSAAANKISEAGAAALASALGSTQLSQLAFIDLNANSVGDSGLIELANVIGQGSCTQLTHLYLSRNSIGNSGVIGFARALEGSLSRGVDPLPRLYELWLSNNALTDESAVCLFSALGKGAIKGLGDIRLQFNRLGDASVAALVDIMNASALSNLWYLGLSDNCFTDAGLQMLEDAIDSAMHKYLNFSRKFLAISLSDFASEFLRNSSFKAIASQRVSNEPSSYIYAVLVAIGAPEFLHGSGRVRDLPLPSTANHCVSLTGTPLAATQRSMPKPNIDNLDTSDTTADVKTWDGSPLTRY